MQIAQFFSANSSCLLIFDEKNPKGTTQESIKYDNYGNIYPLNVWLNLCDNYIFLNLFEIYRVLFSFSQETVKMQNARSKKYNYSL